MSGSSMMSTSDFAPAGMPVRVSGGESLRPPSQVYFVGIVPFGEKAGLESSSCRGAAGGIAAEGTAGAADGVVDETVEGADIGGDDLRIKVIDTMPRNTKSIAVRMYILMP